MQPIGRQLFRMYCDKKPDLKKAINFLDDIVSISIYYFSFSSILGLSSWVVICRGNIARFCEKYILLLTIYLHPKYFVLKWDYWCLLDIQFITECPHSNAHPLNAPFPINKKNHVIWQVFTLKRARFTIKLSISALPTLKKSFYKEHQNVSMITKYNLFTVNTWILKTPKSLLYKKKYLTFSYALLSK